MANYDLVVGSKFQPFSFERYLQPYEIYGKAYREVEDALGDLSAKASIWEGLANEQTDRNTYIQYKNYANDLRQQADKLASEGLNTASRKGLLDMRSRYNREIVPIENAYKRREELAEEQRKALAQNPTMMYERMAKDMSLDDFLSNPSIDYGKSQSGALITERVGDAVKNYADSMLRLGNWTSSADKQIYERLSSTGLTPEDIYRIRTNPNYMPGVQSIIQGVMDSSFSGWNNVPQNALDYAYEGLYSGIGKQAISTRENENFLSNYEQWKWDQEKNKAGKDIYKKTKESKPQNIDRTSYIFERDRQTIPDYLDASGKLNITYGISDRNYANYLFKNDKFTRPEERIPGDVLDNTLMSAKTAYDSIYSILNNSGFTPEQISKMSKSDIEKSLKELEEKGKIDAVARNLYRSSLDANATDFLFDKLQERGYNLHKLEGFNYDKNKKKHVPRYGEKEEITYEAGTSGSIHLDPRSRDFILSYNGDYYKLPKDLISSDLITELDTYFSEDEEGNSEFSRTQDSILYLENKYDTEGLTERELQILEALTNRLKYMDSRMGDLGKSFVQYVGTKNTQ